MLKNPTQIHKRLEEAHPRYAYQLLEMQMAVEDEKVNSAPSIAEITKLLQLYMVGVEVLESIADPRFVYFNNRIHSLMMKKHIVKKLNEVSASSVPKQDSSLVAINKAELQQKKNEYEINYYFNQGQVDIKRVKQILNVAEKKENEFKGKISSDIKKQEVRLQERIKNRKMRSESGSVRKSKDQQVHSPPKDSRFEYFNDSNARLSAVGKCPDFSPIEIRPNSVDKPCTKKFRRGTGHIGSIHLESQEKDAEDAI